MSQHLAPGCSGAPTARLELADPPRAREEHGLAELDRSVSGDADRVLPGADRGRRRRVELVVDRHPARVVAELDEVPLELPDVRAVRDADARAGARAALSRRGAGRPRAFDLVQRRARA